MGNVDISANTTPGSDGDVGMGRLRSLDMWFEHGRLGVRHSVRTIENAQSFETFAAF